MDDGAPGRVRIREKSRQSTASMTLYPSAERSSGPRRLPGTTSMAPDRPEDRAARTRGARGAGRGQRIELTVVAAHDDQVALHGGEEWIGPPVRNLQSSLPVATSSAKR